MPIGRRHQDRIAHGAEHGHVVVIDADASPNSIIRSVGALGGTDTLFIHGSEDARFDDIKSTLIELGHMGACPDVPGRQLWWGSPRGWEGRAGADGDLPIIVSYYTTGTPYEDEARQLIACCDALGLRHRIVGVPARGAWEKNCAMKAGFVREMWRTLARPVLWIDADARVRRAPDLLRACTADFGVHKSARWQFASGTVYFNATDLAGEMLLAWERRCESDPMTWDQVHLDRAWEELSGRAPLETVWLPQAYTRIFDRPADNDGGGATVVEHFQASRRLKAIVSGGAARPFIDFDEATKASRRASRPLVQQEQQ